MLEQFGMSIPLVAAPMSGGPTTPAMVLAATRAGGLGLLAAGYKTVEAVEAEIKKVRSEGIPFGINVFAPNPLPVDPDSYRAYAATIEGGRPVRSDPARRAHRGQRQVRREDRAVARRPRPDGVFHLRHPAA